MTLEEFTGAMDERFPRLGSPDDVQFLMAIMDSREIRGRGTVFRGPLERGSVKSGEDVEIVGSKNTFQATVTSVERLSKSPDGSDNLAVLVRGISAGDIEDAQVLAARRSVRLHRQFRAEVYLLTVEEGGQASAWSNQTHKQFFFRDKKDMTGMVLLPEGIETVTPGESITLDIELLEGIAMYEGLRFTVRDGGIQTGLGVVVCIND